MIKNSDVIRHNAETALQSIWPDWKIDILIGSGSYGWVYRICRTLGQSRIYGALKVISIEENSGPGNAGIHDTPYQPSRLMVEKAIEEIRIMESLKGVPNIVRIEDFKVLWDDADAMILIRMELLESLVSYLARTGVPSQETVIRLGTDLCKALEYCHSKNIIHRDIKPANIFVDEYGNFKLGDFGIARQFDSGVYNTNQTMVGTVSYIAPEVYRGEAYTDSVDIYSLGLVMYEMLNYGRLPLTPAYPQPMTELDNYHAGIRRMSGESFGIPAGAEERLGKIILKACSFRPQDRFRSPEEFRYALEQYPYGTEEPEGTSRKWYFVLAALCLVLIVSVSIAISSLGIFDHNKKPGNTYADNNETQLADTYEAETGTQDQVDNTDSGAAPDESGGEEMNSIGNEEDEAEAAAAQADGNKEDQFVPENGGEMQFDYSIDGDGFFYIDESIFGSTYEEVRSYTGNAFTLETPMEWVTDSVYANWIDPAEDYSIGFFFQGDELVAVQYSKKFTESIDQSLENAIRRRGDKTGSGVKEVYSEDSSKLLGIGFGEGDIFYSCFVNTFTNEITETDIVQLYSRCPVFLFDGEEKLYSLK